MTPIVEREWITRAGSRGLVLRGLVLCGYVELPEGHPWRELAPWDVPATVHGGVSFAGRLRSREGHWVGFDCAHAGDAMPMLDGRMIGDRVWSVDEVAEEVERLAEQVREAGVSE